MIAGHDILLKLEGLDKHFGGLHAIRSLSFTVDRGRITAFIGPNGAGKTTIFNLVTGALKPDEGRVIYADRDITGMRPD